MDSKRISNIYSRVINIIFIAFLLILNYASFVAIKENGHYKDNVFFSHFSYYIVLEVVLLGILLLVNLFFLRKCTSQTKKCKSSEDIELTKYQKEIDIQYKVLEKIASLYDTTVKCTNEKSQFFYNMSHELKTPLTVILGAIQLIEQKNSRIQVDRRNSSKHIATIKQNCYRLLRLINNMLDLSRIESGYIKSNMVNCNIVYLIEEIAQSVIPYAEQKSLTLEFDTMSEEIITSVDIDKIERIILNLLSNAIKYTNPGGKISINISEKNNKVHILVKDTGIGIPKHMLNNVFERYQQVDSSLTRGIEGSGLGLSIVKSFVGLHGGTIKVKSEENVGSEFHVILPIKHMENANSCERETEHDNQLRIIEAINIEFSEIYHLEEGTAIKVVKSAGVNR